MPRALVPCRACRRHIRTDGVRCPFCDTPAETRATFRAVCSIVPALLPALALGLVFAPAQAATEGAKPAVEEGSVVAIYGTAPSWSRTRNAIQADLGLAVVGLAYERIVTRHVAVQVEGQLFGTWWGPTFDLPRFGGVGAQLRPTVFLAGDAPRGLYVAPFFRGARVSATQDGITGTGFGWSAGAFIGYSFVFGDRWNLRIGGGAQYMSYAVDAGPARVEWKRFYPGLDLVVGVMF